MKKIVCDLFSSLKNAQLAKKTVLFHKKNKLCFLFLNLLWDEGLILGFRLANLIPFYFEIYLKYPVVNSRLVTLSVKVLRRFNNQVFLSLKQLWKIPFTTEILVLSTSKGLLTHVNCKKYRVGGKPVLIIK